MCFENFRFIDFSFEDVLQRLVLKVFSECFVLANECQTLNNLTFASNNDQKYKNIEK